MRLPWHTRLADALSRLFIALVIVFCALNLMWTQLVLQLVCVKDRVASLPLPGSSWSIDTVVLHCSAITRDVVWIEARQQGSWITAPLIDFISPQFSRLVLTEDRKLLVLVQEVDSTVVRFRTEFEGYPIVIQVSAEPIRGFGRPQQSR